MQALEDYFGTPATEVVSEEGQQKLVDTVIDYFAEDRDGDLEVNHHKSADRINYMANLER